LHKITLANGIHTYDAEGTQHQALGVNIDNATRLSVTVINNWAASESRRCKRQL